MVALSPVAGLHLYVYGAVPLLAVALSVVLLPGHIETLAPASALIAVRTVTIMLLVPVHPLASVTDSVYVVVAVGLAVGLAPVVALSPVAGVHLYVYGAVPLLAVPFSVVLLPGHIETLAPASALTAVRTVTIMLLVPVHPLASVTDNV